MPEPGWIFRGAKLFSPADVTGDGVSARFKTGVLGLRSKKTPEGQEKEISID